MTNQANRRKYLKAQRARASRRSAPQPANARFECESCGFQFEYPGNIMIANVMLVNHSTGQEVKLPVDQAVAGSHCPRCRQPARALNQYSARHGEHAVTGFADTPAQKREFITAIEQLEALGGNATFEEIIETLERQGDRMRPVVDYLRENHIALMGLAATVGFGFVGLVIAILAWLAPRDAGDPPVTPDGITHEQMEVLIAEVRAAGDQKAEDPAHDREQSAKGRPRNATGGPEDRGSEQAQAADQDHTAE